MGVGGGLKGHGTQISSGSGRAGRPYWWMLLLFVAFGALIFGVMALHKHRERRIFGLVVKDKDLQLHSLHLHLQKERDFAKEAKRKSKELKSELYTLRNQKSELSGKILEMQSTISSLQEEHKAIESALEEKQNAIDLMKEREKHVNEQNSRGSYLAKDLSLKEAEFEDLKSNPELPATDWNINFRYPNFPMNLTTRVGIARMDETFSTSKENGGRLHNPTKTADGGNLTNGENGRETENVAVSRKISGEEPKIQKSSQHKITTNENHSEQMSYNISRDGESLDIDTQKGNTNGIEARVNSAVDSEKPKDVNGATLTANSKFGKNGQDKNVAGITGGKRFFKNKKDGKQKQRPGEAELLKLFKEKGQSLGLDIRTASNENDAKFKLFNPVPWKEGKESKGDTKVGSESKTKKDHSSGVLKSFMNSENSILERFSQSADEVQVKRNISKGSRATSDDKKKKPKDIVRREAKNNGNPHRIERSSNDKEANPKKRNSGEKNADIADWEVDDIHESDAHKLAV